MSGSREMPRYQCHKKVWALKIKSVTTERRLNGDWFLSFEEQGFADIRKDAEWADKHKPQPGGYYVVYADGYASYSPAKAFEEGYTRIEVREDDDGRLIGPG